jgi:hypothetical protein
MRRGRSPAGIVARLLIVVAVFVLGVGLGASLDDNTEPGTTTFERTIRLEPPPTVTVTVTVP